MRGLILFALLFFLSSGWTGNSNPLIEMDFFVSSTCSHCHKAEAFFNTRASGMPWLKINKYVINEDKKALEYFYQRLKAVDSSDFTVPTMFFCNTRHVGFDTPEQMGRKLMEALQDCRKRQGDKAHAS